MFICKFVFTRVFWRVRAFVTFVHHYGKTGKSLLLCSFCAKSRIRVALQIVLVCLYSTPFHYHHCANISEDIELTKFLSYIFVECVSKIKHILSVIHYTICGAVCFQFTHFPCDDRQNIYTLSYYHRQIGSMNYYPLFRIRLWNNGVRCMSIFLWRNHGLSDTGRVNMEPVTSINSGIILLQMLSKLRVLIVPIWMIVVKLIKVWHQEP